MLKWNRLDKSSFDRCVSLQVMEAPQERQKQFFPMLPREQLSSSVMVATLEEKLVRTTTDVAATLGELELRRREAEELRLNGELTWDQESWHGRNFERKCFEDSNN